MDKVTVKFNNGIVKTFKTLKGSEIPTIKICHGCHAMYLHYSHIQKAKDLLKDDDYLNRSEYFLPYFGATVLSIEKLDGRSVEAKSLYYFTIGECLKNY
jgi:hypothetical protein